MRYYDDELGELRFKPRYVWAFWAYIVGLACGMVAIPLLH